MYVFGQLDIILIKINLLKITILCKLIPLNQENKSDIKKNCTKIVYENLYKKMFGS